MKFCGECAAPLVPTCPSCGATNPPEHKFCGQCATPLKTTPTGKPVAPESYTPKHLAEKILTSRGAIEGERKQVTVLFADVADSSQLAQQVDPEVMHQVMDQVLRLMAEAVHRYEGTVNQYLGDGLMALFGAPVALEDHALRAVQAGLALQETIRGYNPQLQRDHGVQLRLRLGLNTGAVVVGRIGDDLRMDYTAAGNTTHLAARLQALAEPGTMLITEATHRLVEGYIRTEALGPVEVRGQHEPVTVYSVMARRRRTRLEVSAERGLTRIVGRQRELAVLHDCLARAKAGRGQVVGIVGEAGVGKSRLLHEFQTSLDASRVVWLVGHCVGYGQGTPYLPILEILRTNFQIEDGDNPLQMKEKLREGVHWLDPALEGILPSLRALLTASGEEETLKRLSPKEKRQKTFEAIRALTVTASQRRPHVVVLEDLHWIDHSSEEYLAFLIESLAGLPLVLLTTHRPGYAVRWADKAYYTQIALDGLTEQEAEAMAATLLGTHDLPADLLQVIQEKAGGNPLFIEEVTHSLLERGILVLRHDSLYWAGDAVVEFPVTVQDIMRARIDRLEEPVKRMVQMAAVIGREFGLRLLTQLSDVAAKVELYLDMLKHQEFIHEKRVFPELEYIFKHAVIQEVAYQSLLTPRRQQLHGAIGRAIEELDADRVEEHAAILAYHYARSEQREKAVAHSLRAGDRATRLYAHAEATTHYMQALLLARALPASPEAQRAQIDAILKLAAVGATRQDMERDRKNLEQARALAAALGDDARLAQVLYWLGRLAYVRGEYPAALTCVEQSLAIADQLDDDALSAPPVNLMGRVYFLFSDYLKASRLLARSVEQMRRLGNTSEEATAAGFAGFAFGFMGEFESAFVHANHGLHLAREIQNPFAEAAAYFYRGLIHEQRGAWPESIKDCEEARRIGERVGDLFRIYVVKCTEGRVYTLSGDPARGRALLEEAAALAEQLGTNFWLAWRTSYLAACLLALGELEAVPPLCYEAIRVADVTGDQYPKTLAQRTLAEAWFALGSAAPESADELMLEAIRLQQSIGAKPELSRSYVTYARTLQARGERDKARMYLIQAIDMFRQMAMTWDLVHAEQTLHSIP
jgi:class 3 adenylate cyclase/tetratricopeptide (TPR) repeat protein